MSFINTLWSLRWSLLLSVALGLVLVLISFLGTEKLKFTGVVWAVAICVSLTLGKVLTRRNEIIVAVFGLAGVFLAKVINDQTLLDYDVVDVVRILLYPILGWTVVRLERSDLAKLSNTLQVWLFPMVVLPLIAGVVVAITENPPSKIVAEIVFASGCALILHIQRVPEVMSPLFTVATALIAGAAASTGGAAIQVIKDARTSLKDLINRKFHAAPNADDLNATLRIAEKKPSDKSRHRLLHEELQAANVHEDAEVLRQAQVVLRLVQQHAPAIARQYNITQLAESAPEDAGTSTGFTTPEGARLYHLLIQSFSKDDIESLCAEMGLDRETSSDEFKTAPARALVRYCETTNHLAELKKLMRVQNPKLREQLQ